MKRYHKHDERSYTLGITVTFEMLQLHPELVTHVYYHTEMIHNETFDRIYFLCQKNQIPFVQNDKVFKILSEKENCFVIGEFIKSKRDVQSHTNHLVLVNPSNVGNLGTMIRTAVGFGFNDIILIRPAVDIFDPKVIRASMGAFFHIRFNYFDDFEVYHQSYPQHHKYLFMLDAHQSLAHIHPKTLYALVFGNEATGLSNQIKQLGTSVRIFHLNTIDSLNLPNAVSIALYELTKDVFQNELGDRNE